MKILVSPFGSHGDVHPFIGLAVELQNRGHEVLFAVNEHFRELTESAGLTYVEMGKREPYLELAGSPEVTNPMRSFQFIFREGVGKILQDHIDWIESEYEPGKTISISSLFGFGARVAQLAFGIPTTSVHLQPAVIWSEHDSPQLANVFCGPRVPRWFKRLQIWVGETFVLDRTVRPILNPVLDKYGLEPMKGTLTWWHSPERVIGLFPDWYASPQPDWPEQVRLANFPLWDEADLSDLVPELREFLAAGEKPIVFTPGSSVQIGESFFAAAAEACDRLGRRGLLLTRFPAQIPKALPTGVAYFPYAPFSRLLPESALLVHYGGVGSTAQAMAAGIPQLIMPMSNDQFDNVYRVKRLGVGDEISRSRFTADELCRRLPPLLTNEAIAANCREIARRFVGQSGISQAADIIEADMRSHDG